MSAVSDFDFDAPPPHSVIYHNHNFRKPMHPLYEPSCLAGTPLSFGPSN